MFGLLPFISSLLLFISCSNVAADALDVDEIRKDIAEFNMSCYGVECDFYPGDSLISRPCHCGIQCVQLGTCCVDSHYASIPQPELKPSCRSINAEESYFIVDQCHNDSEWASLCNNEWNEDNDVQKLVPVTSLMTSITYKNYYCLRCHESTDEFLYWVLKLEGNLTLPNISTVEYKQLNRRVSLIYNKDMATWMAIYDEDVGYFPVILSIQVPNGIRELIHYCEPDVISDCSEKWLDEEVRRKCQSYMAMKVVFGIPIKYYKNTHCALCNFENLDDIQCKKIKAIPFGGSVPFSFTYLLDINQSDGELVGKVRKCSEDHLWDPFTKKCRKLTCAQPGFKIKNGRCVKE